jgi:aldehyde dehydrogenase (NAD+)
MSKLPHYQLYIGGTWIDGEQPLVETLNPATGKIWATFSCASKEQVDNAVRLAKQAQQSVEWRQMCASNRAKLLYKLADIVEKNVKKIAEVESLDSGKLLKETMAQTGYVAEYYRYFAGMADKIEGGTLPIDKANMFVYTTREPIGVVAAIVPWNSQMFLAATKLAPALAMGCSVIIKASEIAPCAMLEFAKLLDEVGFPKGVISIITGDAENCAVPLTSHPDIDRLAFTGGAETAKHIVRNSAENFAVTTLELGGKSPIIIFDDADLESAINGIIAGNYGASGQSCVAGSRVIIQRTILDKVIAKVKLRAKEIVIGDPLDDKTHMGPLCTVAQVENIERVLLSSQKQGAKVHFGGERVNKQSGNYFQPTLIECPTIDVDSINTEFFGPIMSVIAFDTEEEAIEMANKNQFGLGSGVFTQNLARAHRVSKEIRAGICWVNTYRAISPIAPFGGYNKSGYGREAGWESMLDYTRTKTTWINIDNEPMSNPFVIR